MREVNFLSERRKKLSKVELQDQKALRIVGIVLGVTFSVFLLLVIVSVYFSFQLGGVKAAQKVARSQITENQQIEESFVVFVHKLTALSLLSQARQQKNDAIEYFNTVFGPEVFIVEIEYDQTNQLIIFKLEAKEVFSLKKVLDLINSQEVKEKFALVSPSSLQRKEDGQYQITISVVTSKEALAKQKKETAPGVGIPGSQAAP
jgi:hypothetical protein